jgi:Fe(3+) dicitrate transport protein
LSEIQHQPEHQFDLKLAYSDEVSSETYTGLTDEDFAADPYRRYRGTQLDRMDWRHYQAQLSHRTRLGGVDLVTTAYHHAFDRDWRKLDGFGDGTSLAQILASPDTGNNAVRYAVLTGAEDTLSSAETLILGTNARSFVSQGAQLVARTDQAWLGALHSIELGTRLHRDEVVRYHYEDGYDMRAGQLVPAAMERAITLDSTGSTIAWASHYQHKLTLGDWQATAGLRAELMATEYDDHMSDNVSRDDFFVLLPGAGVVWQALPALAALAGVHRGFVPVSPGQTGASPERSVNYEAGVRWLDLGTNVEIIGFFSDYQNLLGTCTFSSGCDSEQVGEDFDGGAVHAYGVESLVSSAPAIGRDLRLPLRLGYTFQRSTFQSSFSSDNPQWGDVMRGDEMPYLPVHQLQVQAGVAGAGWDVALSGRYLGAMRDTPGQDGGDSTLWTDSATILDLAASYAPARWGKLYLTVNNLLDEAHVTSRRPYGARPGAPRLIVLGYKTSL